MEQNFKLQHSIAKEIEHSIAKEIGKLQNLKFKIQKMKKTLRIDFTRLNFHLYICNKLSLKSEFSKLPIT